MEKKNVTQVQPFMDFRQAGFRHRLYDDVLIGVSEEFAAPKLMARIGAESDPAKIKAICSQYGKELMTKAIELGEKYQDRTYYQIKELAARTGTGPFPHTVQRYFEIAYMGLLPLKGLPVLASRINKLSYRISPCAVYDSIKEAKGAKVASAMACEGLCLSMAATLYQHFGVSPKMRTDATMAKEGYCLFTAER